MSERQQLIDLQEIDTAVDRLRNRIERLEERVAMEVAAGALAENDRRRREASSALQVATDALAANEAESSDVDAHRSRLSAQMKTIISPREAEALQKEIDTLVSRRSDLDDHGLELLDAVADAESEIAAADAERPQLEERLAESERARTSAESVLLAEVDALVSRRRSAAEVLPDGLLDRYESMRRTHGGMAVARLAGSQCSGCHLELSRAESEAVRHVPDDQLPDCPSCGRLLLP